MVKKQNFIKKSRKYEKSFNVKANIFMVISNYIKHTHKILKKKRGTIFNRIVAVFYCFCFVFLDFIYQQKIGMCVFNAGPIMSFVANCPVLFRLTLLQFYLLWTSMFSSSEKGNTILFWSVKDWILQLVWWSWRYKIEFVCNLLSLWKLECHTYAIFSFILFFHCLRILIGELDWVVFTVTIRHAIETSLSSGDFCLFLSTYFTECPRVKH